MDVYTADTDLQNARNVAEMIMENNPMYQSVLNDIKGSLSGDSGLVADIIKGIPNAYEVVMISEDGCYVVGFKIDDNRFLAYQLVPIIYQKSD